MATVPVYDQFQVRPSGGNIAPASAPRGDNLAAKQAQELGQNIMQAGNTW